MGTPVKWGREFLVNTTTYSDQKAPSVTGLADGRFVVTWTSFGGIRAQVFSADGTMAGSEVLVRGGGDAVGSLVTPLLNGGFVVTWTQLQQQSGGLPTISVAVEAQRFRADGSPAGNAFLVHWGEYTSVSTIATLSDGRFVVAWNNWGAASGDNSGTGVLGQIFNPNGSPVGSEFLINSATTGNQGSAKITGLANGGFVATWTSDTPSGGDASAGAVHGQIFSANGLPSGVEFLVNTTKANSQFHQSVTALAGGGFVVSWTDASQTGADSSGLAVRAQVFNDIGAKSGQRLCLESGGNSPAPSSERFDLRLIRRRGQVSLARSLCRGFAIRRPCAW